MHRCRQCQALIYGNAEQTYCPACLLRMGLEPETATLPLPSGGKFRVPPIAELQTHLPALEFHELVGQGGMGAVYRARQRELERPVAVKVLPEDLSADPQFVERFRREARALARLDHPNIVKIFEAGVADGWCYIVMEWIEGVTLRHAITVRSVDAATALQIVSQICAALQYAHQQGVVHRDIKPENIILCTSGQVKVTDFGLAKLVDLDPQDASLTATGVRMGTMRYMAPEQFDARTIDHRADIYSLGVVFYELLTGQVPMGHFALPSSTASIDPRIDRVVLRTLEREPDRRYQWACEVQSDLSDLSRVAPYATDPGSQRFVDPRYMARGGYAWRSRAHLWGVPLVCIATGIDPSTGKKRVAKGIIAIGDVAVGLIALGGVANGLLAVGGVSFGAVTLGGVAFGMLFALGGAAIGTGLSVGGGALGTLALGGAAIGLIAVGGGAVGYAAAGGSAVGRFTHAWGVGWTPQPLDSIAQIAQQLTRGDLNLSLAGYVGGCLLIPLLLVAGCAILAHRSEADRAERWHRGATPSTRFAPQAVPPWKQSAPGTHMGLGCLTALALLLVMLFLVLVIYYLRSAPLAPITM